MALQDCFGEQRIRVAIVHAVPEHSATVRPPGPNVPIACKCHAPIFTSNNVAPLLVPTRLKHECRSKCILDVTAALLATASSSPRHEATRCSETNAVGITTRHFREQWLFHRSCVFVDGVETVNSPWTQLKGLELLAYTSTPMSPRRASNDWDSTEAKTSVAPLAPRKGVSFTCQCDAKATSTRDGPCRPCHWYRNLGLFLDRWQGYLLGCSSTPKRPSAQSNADAPSVEPSFLTHGRRMGSNEFVATTSDRLYDDQVVEKVVDESRLRYVAPYVRPKAQCTVHGVAVRIH